MSNDFLNLATDLLSGALSGNVTCTTTTNVVQIPRYGEPGPKTLPPEDDRLERLLLVCTAMWQLIKEKTDLTEDDLISRVAVLDAQDGIADGKLTEKPQPCPKCQRTVCTKQGRCLYCGCPIPVDNVFRTI
jgi:hypothetical protein